MTVPVYPIPPGVTPPQEQPSYSNVPSLIPTPPLPFNPADSTPDTMDQIAPGPLGVPTGQVFYQTQQGTQGNPPAIGVLVPYFQGMGLLTQFQNMKEYAGSGKVSYSRSGWKGTRIFEVPWFQWMDFANALLGYSVQNPNGPPTYYLPDVFSSGMPWLFCRELDMEPLDDLIRGVDADPLTPRVYYERAKITANYYPLDMDISFKISGQILDLPGSEYAWMGNDARLGLNDVYGGGPVTTLAQNVGKIIPGGEFGLVKHYMPAPYFDMLIQMIGCVNVVAFLGFQPTTLLMTGIEAKRTWTLNGEPVWDITATFTWQPNSWIALYNPSPDGNVKISGIPFTTPGYQYIRSVATPKSYSQTNPSPPLTWTDGTQIGPDQNPIGVATSDYGFLYSFADFTALLYFI